LTCVVAAEGAKSDVSVAAPGNPAAATSAVPRSNGSG
jgi:hypothetical protein